MWASIDGPSPQERMYDYSRGKIDLEQSVKGREQNYQEVRARIYGEDGVPMIYFFDNCKHFWRTVPDLQLDDLHPEKGYDTDQEDHMADVFAYACASRPMAKTEADRMEDEWDRVRDMRKNWDRKRKRA